MSKISLPVDLASTTFDVAVDVAGKDYKGAVSDAKWGYGSTATSVALGLALARMPVSPYLKIALPMLAGLAVKYGGEELTK